MNNKFLILLSSILFNSQISLAQNNNLDLSLEEGNHTWAKSEAWTWMGHLNEYTQDSPTGKIQLRNDGVALIHYYTRNETQFGNLNFKSSALTYTKNNIGTVYDKNTIYSEATNSGNKFEMKIKEHTLDIQFQHKKNLDIIKKVEMKDQDHKTLNNTLLPLFENLNIAQGFSPVKYIMQSHVGSHSYLNIEFYQIWPSIAPENARMKFLGLSETFTFSQPMLVAIGKIKKDGVDKKVVGLLFLDRQWSKEYFGTYIMSDPLESLKQNQALKYSHSWSAFHAYSAEAKNWYFVHLWQQFKRTANFDDTLVDYSGVLWAKNGVQQNSIHSNEFSWKGSNYVKNKSIVMLNYAVGREKYFPSEYKYNNLTNNDNLKLQASPPLQSLDQPIYLFEGYATGFGVWNNENVEIKGRLESSRILFRKQDYQEIISNIDFSNKYNFNEKQDQLKIYLEKKIVQEEWCEFNILCFIDYLKIKKAQIDYAFNDLNRKLIIAQSGMKTKGIIRDPNDKSKVIYN